MNTSLKKILILRPCTTFIMCCLLISCTFFSCIQPEETHIASWERQYIDSLVHAQKEVDSLEQIRDRFIQEDNHYGLMVTCKTLGQRYRSENRFMDAVKCHKLGMEQAILLADTLELIQALNNLGTNYRRLGILTEASTFHYRALSFCELLQNKTDKLTQKQRVISLNGIGNIYLTLDNRQLADSIFRIALRGEQQLGSAVGQAINYANLGAIFESNGQTDSAWIYYQHSMKQNQKAKSDLGISLCHNSFGRLYEKDCLWDSALVEYQASYDIMAGSKDRWHWLESCLALTRVHLKKGDYSKAYAYLEQAKKTATDIKSLEHLAQVYYLYYQWYDQKGDCRKALDYYIQSRIYTDSVMNFKNLHHAQNLRIQFVSDRHRDEINVLERSYENERRTHNYLLIASLAIILLAVTMIGFLWYFLHSRRKMIRMMQHVEEIRSNFFTNITHEFRTPLTVILGYSRLLENGTVFLKQDLQSLGQYITRQGNNLLDLVNQLLDISKVKSAVGNPEWRTGNVVPYLHMLVESFQDLARLKRIELQFLPSQNTVNMDFVPDYLQKILRNLISNALNYTPAYGKICIDTDLTDNMLEIHVSDTGKGIAEEDLPHIFDLFYQGNKEKVKEVGSGIGLSLVQKLVMSMNGTIEVESKVGIGTIFTLFFPLFHKGQEYPDFRLNEITIEKVALTTKDGESENLPQGKESNEHTPLILVVEDNLDVAHYIGSLLQERYALRYAYNGRIGIELAYELVPDLILTDLMMPVVDGYALLRCIRESETVNHIPVIVITARCTEEDRIKGIEAGADAYLYKPFNAEELLVRVDYLLDSRRMLRSKYAYAVRQQFTNAEKQLAIADQQFLNRLTDITYRQMETGQVDVETIASKMCMTRQQLTRKLQAVTGESTVVYLMRIRLNKAKQLLDSCVDMQIGDIAIKCGFEDNAYFSRIFKQYFHLTPSQYRKQLK